jgi:small subunit ribosomal protein S6
LNPYEMTFIVRPDLEDDQTTAVIDQVTSRIEDTGGSILSTIPWSPARRRMAYPIRDFGDGVYVTVHFEYESQTLREFERWLRLNERILRFLIVRATELQLKQAQQKLSYQQAAAAQLASEPLTPESDAAVESGQPADLVEAENELTPAVEEKPSSSREDEASGPETESATTPEQSTDLVDTENEAPAPTDEPSPSTDSETPVAEVETIAPASEFPAGDEPPAELTEPVAHDEASTDSPPAAKRRKRPAKESEPVPVAAGIADSSSTEEEE